MTMLHRQADPTEYRRRRLPAIALAIGLTAAACSGADQTATPDPTEGPNPAPTAEPTDGPTSTARPTTAPTPTAEPTPRIPPPVSIDENGFNDHSVPALASVEEFFALSVAGPGGQSVVKFTIPLLLTDTHGARWMDGNFFSLHDEWYWFRLMNGQRVPAINVAPFQAGESFDTIADIYDWAEGRSVLPLDLRLVDSRFTTEPRLYSARYYRAGLRDEPRNYGLGSVIHVAARDDRAERWIIELEYSDDPTPDEVGAFFDRLTAAAPPEIGDNLEWVVRSPAQEETAQTMEAADLPYADRIVRYSEIVPPGEVQVYNEGIAAGRLLYIGEDGAELSDATEDDILVLATAPDWLPPAAALITDAPQTPLAHVNLLARNRGIPNASQSAVLDDAGIRQAARVRAHAIVRAADGELEVVLITRDEYEQWEGLLEDDPIAVAPVDTGSTPLTYDLTELADTVGTEADLAALRPLIGGKAAGMLTLLDADGVEVPDAPMAISVVAYLEHLEQFERTLSVMLADATFRDSARARYLLLEGAEDYADFYTSDGDAAFAAEFLATHPRGTVLGDILAAEGFTRLFRDQPMAEDTLAELTDALEAAYGDYAVTQGLRFRSSSSVEDIEGFSGAGLYDSNTGYLDPEAQEEKDRKRSVEWALKKTWASYWGFEAFEERRQEAVDHRSGAMAVLVHARFDDDLERNNGVATFTLLPAGDPDAAVVVINTQLGAESVTNPDPESGALPEVIEVRLGDDGSMAIDRIASSTLTTDNVLGDAEVRALVDQLESTTRLWRDRINADLPATQDVGTVTLDFEFKHMRAGWPAGLDDTPARLIVKQARSLDPGLRGIPDSLLVLPIPRDVLARTRLATEYRCEGATEPTVEVLTDPLLAPDVGHGTSPFVVGEPRSGECTRRTLHATPDQFLIALLASGDRVGAGG